MSDVRGENSAQNFQHVTVLYREKLKLLFDGLTERKMFSRPNFDSDLVFPFCLFSLLCFFSFGSDFEQHVIII